MYTCAFEISINIVVQYDYTPTHIDPIQFEKMIPIIDKAINDKNVYMSEGSTSKIGIMTVDMSTTSL